MNKFLKKALVLNITICIFSPIFSQNKIVYFNENWDTVPKSEATYYRSAMKLNGSRYEFKDFFMNGTLQFEGGSASASEEILEGLCKWYYKNGKLMQTAYYNAGQKNGETDCYHEDGYELARGIYEYDEPKNGSFLTYSEFCREIDYINDNSIGKVVIIDLDFGTKAKYEYYTSDTYTNYTFYDQNGKKIGDSQVDNETEYTLNGVEVIYYYNPMTVASVAEVKDGIYTSKRINYYGNGKIKSIEYVHPPDEDGNQYPAGYIFFDKSGNKLDSVICKNKRRDTGNFYQYYQSKNAKIGDQIAQIIPYKDAYLHGKSKTFYRNGALESVFDYEWDKLHGWKITYDSVSGKEIYRMMYVQGLALNGTERNGDTIREIRKNNIISETVLFDNGKTKHKKTATNYDEYYIQYYDYNGSYVGTCYVKDESPVKGDLVEYFENDISHSRTFSNGEVEGENIFYNNKLLYSSKINGIQKMYDPLSDKVYTCTMQDGMPFQGTFVTYLDGQIAEITEYSNGSKNGSSVKYNYDEAEHNMKPEYEVVYKDDILNGPFTYFTNVHTSSKGVFENNEYKGTVTYFNIDGTVRSTLEFRDGIPCNGIETDFFYNGSVLSEFEYKNCIKIRTTHFEEGVIRENTIFSAPRSFNREVFYSNGKIKEEFSVANGLIEGDFKIGSWSGDVLGIAKFKNGDFKSGTMVFFDDQYFNYDYLTLTIGKKEFTVEYIRTDGEDDKFVINFSELGKNKYESVKEVLRNKYENIDFEIISSSDIE